MRYLSQLQSQKIFLGFVVILLFLSVPVTLLVVRTTTKTNSHASASTKLYFSPPSSTDTPLQKNNGDTIPLDLMVDPGNNSITNIKFQIQFDPTKLALVNPAAPLSLNDPSVLHIAEGPQVTENSLTATISIGSDPTKIITSPTKIGTITFRAIGNTDQSPTLISFQNLTQVLSAASADQTSENVLSTTEPAAVTIGVQDATPSATVSPVPTAVSTILSFNLLLHGVGNSGDNSNPNNYSLSNQNPLHPQRNFTVWISDSNNQQVTRATGSANFDPNTGGFTGSIDLGPSFPTGNYIIRVQTDRYLRKLVPGIQQIKTLTNNPIPDTSMAAGDVNGDNILDIRDYNALLDCGFGDVSPLPLLDPNATFNSKVCQAHSPAVNVDLDDDGIIDSLDYNLFLRELAVQNGD
jgi:hypothetical protein